jgi:hypothetical protein
MEKQTLPEMRERGLLKRVVFALVDVDEDRDVGQSLVSGGPIPQLILFRRTREGWTNHRLIGGQTIPTLEQFINDEVAASEADHKTLAKAIVKAKAKIKPASLSKETPTGKPASKAAPAREANQPAADKKQTASASAKDPTQG